MKYFNLIVLLSLIITSDAHAQSVTTTTFNAPDNASIDFRYRYPTFQNGYVFFKDGSKGIGEMNYNMLSKEIHFIDAKRDTMALADVFTIKELVIGSDTFFFDKGVLEIIGNYEKIKLVVRETLRMADRQKIGAYGIKTSTSSIDTYNTIRLNQGTYGGLSVAEHILYAKDKIYYLRVKENMLLPVNWNNLAKVFPKKRNTMAAFATENRIDLNKEEDLKKLLTFCSVN